MVIHIYFTYNEPRTIETSRVSLTEKMNNIAPGQVTLVLGTVGSKDFQYYPMDDISWFWIEDN